jgi:hypothetical protein
MGYSQRIAWETLRTIDSASAGFSTGYNNLGTPLIHAGYIVKLVNASTVLVTISIDGVNDVDVAPANSFWLYDEGKVGQVSAMPALPAGTQIMVKGAAAGTGLVYLVVQYLVVA